jgi:hypothetical protein
MMSLRRTLILGACLLGAALVACGGSSSETPWPAEPSNAALGPAGEAAPGAVIAADPDAGVTPAPRAKKPE